MADVNKTVQVDVRASLKDILKKFKSLPGLTEKEAKEMARGFAKQLRQTERAAKNAAKTNQKAMKEMGKSFDHARTKAKSLRTQSRELGGSLAAMEDVIREVNPEIGGLATTVQTFGMGFRALSRSLATGNVILIGLLGVITAGVAVYTAFTASTRAAEEQQKRFKEATEETQKAISEQANTIRGLQSDFDNATRNLLVFSGQMSQFDADIAKAREANQKALDDDLKKQDELILKNESLMALARKAGKVGADLTEEEEERLKNAIALTRDKRLRGALDIGARATTEKMFILEQHIKEANQEQLKLRAGIIQRRGEELDATLDLLALQEELRKESEEEEARERRRAEARAKAKEREAKLNEILNASQASINQLQSENIQLFSRTLDDRDKILLKYEVEREKLNEQKNLMREQLETARQTAKTKEDQLAVAEIENQLQEQESQLREKEFLLEVNRQKELADLQTKHREQILKGKEQIAKENQRIHDAEMKQLDAGLKASIGGITEFTRAGMELLSDSGEENAEIINALFRINQAAALADIAMSTAKGIARAPADYGPLAPAAIPIIAASGAAQAAVVLSQSPPMHMGGMVAPDERQARVLTGESVLDRSTTRRLGDDGIRRLQNGGGMEPQVVVLNPYKHLDRYNKSAIRSQKSALKKYELARGAGRY